MTKPNERKRRPARAKVDKRGNGAIPILKVKKGANLKEIYAAARRAFTAADLQKYTEIEAGIPLQEIIAEMETIQRGDTAKRQKRKKKA